MAKGGDTIVGPTIGQTITFETTGMENDGEVTICHHYVKPKGQSVGPPEHTHWHQAEHYTVLEGSFGVQKNGVDHVLGPGEKITVEAGVPHLWWNEGDTDAHVILEFRPAGTIDAFFETLFGLSRDGKAEVHWEDGVGKARPNSLFQAVALSYDHGIGICDVPAPIQKFIFPVMVRLGRLVGIRGMYPKYSPDKFEKQS
jgi:quercetin dioxygenase-like cupin family protein